MGGVRQQFSTEPEVRLAQASVRLFQELGAPLFEQVGYLFLATTDEGLAELGARAEVQRGLGVPVEDVDAASVRGLRTDDVLGAVMCREDGIADPAAVTRELARDALEGAPSGPVPHFKSLRTSRAAFAPGPPVTPPPGWAPAPQRYSPATGAR